jgi:hypothetical protein
VNWLCWGTTDPIESVVNPECPDSDRFIYFF